MNLEKSIPYALIVCLTDSQLRLWERPRYFYNTGGMITMTASITSRTEEQETHLRRLGEDALKHGFDLLLKKVNPDLDGMPLLIERGGEYQDAIIDAMIAAARNLTVSNKYADQEVKSNYGYLSGYRQPNPISQQIALLAELFSEVHLGAAKLELANMEVNSLAEGWFAIPDWHIVAPTYSQAVQKILDLIKKTRGRLYNYREGQIDERHLRESKRSQRAWDMIRSSQPNCGILLVQAQFGLRHAGKSDLRALETMPYSYEFGLGAYANGVMILTHQNRLANYNDLWIDCAGDEFSDEGVGVFERAPLWGFSDGRVGFGAIGVGSSNGYYGSSSGFLAQ